MNVANVWFPSVKRMITKQFEIHFSVLDSPKSPQDLWPVVG